MLARSLRTLVFIVLGLLGLLGLVGCGGSAGAPPPVYVTESGGDSTAAGEAAGYDMGAEYGDGSGSGYGAMTSSSPAVDAQATARGSLQAEAEYEPPTDPQSRPGLGTEFGEQVHSRINRTAFYRASSSPFATVAMFYNDAEGVAAQVAYRGGYDQPVRAYTPNRGISVWAVDEHGRVLPGTTASGRTYVVGADGQRYNLVIQNHTGGRFEVVASVDGLDVVDGRPASVDRRGYLLNPYGQIVIEGFRTSDDSVAAFRFGSVARSYAARTSGDRNVGVIGFAFFSERGSRWTTDELNRRETANPFPAYSQPPPGY